jgi:hypothetical protein
MSSSANLLGYNPNPYRSQNYPITAHPFSSKYPWHPYNEYDLNAMMQKVKTMVNHLLRDVTLLYQSMKIRYPVIQYEPVLVRMLVPVELSAAINSKEI